MEYYDTFDENGVFLSSEDETDVHYKGLWHKVIRVWLYDTSGNLYLRVRSEDNKLDCINEQHMWSSESVSSCFDRGMFEKLGVHLPATSNIEMAYQNKIKVHKVYSDGSELKDNYFLCDYVGEFDRSASFFIFSDDTKGLVKVNAKGVLGILSTRTGEVVGETVVTSGQEGEKRYIAVEDIFASKNENLYAKYSNVITHINNLTLLHNKGEKELAKLKKYAEKNKEQEEFVSHADENEGDIVY